MVEPGAADPGMTHAWTWANTWYCRRSSSSDRGKDHYGTTANSGQPLAVFAVHAYQPNLAPEEGGDVTGTVSTQVTGPITYFALPLVIT